MIKVKGMLQLNANGQYVINELALAKLTSWDFVNMINKMIAGHPIEFFRVGKIVKNEFVSVDIGFMDTGVSLLYNIASGDVYHEQMGFETIKRFIDAGIIH